MRCLDCLHSKQDYVHGTVFSRDALVFLCTRRFLNEWLMVVDPLTDRQCPYFEVRDEVRVFDHRLRHDKKTAG